MLSNTMITIAEDGDPSPLQEQTALDPRVVPFCDPWAMDFLMCAVPYAKKLSR